MLQFSGSVKFNRITREENLEISIKSYKDQCCEHMVRNGMRDVSSITYPQNKKKKWDLLLYHYIFPLECVKRHVRNIQKGTKADK